MAEAVTQNKSPVLSFMKLKILLALMGMSVCVAHAATNTPAFPQADLMRIGV